MKRGGLDGVYFREILFNIFHQKRLLMILLLSFFVVILAVIIYFSFFLSVQELICGDETEYNNCSDRQPYFCEEGILIERASLCGCSENLTINEDICISKYQTGAKNITLNYLLRGEDKKIDFVVYNGLTNYLSKIPRSIHNVNGEIPTKEDFKFKKIDEEQQRYLLLPLVTKIQNLANDEKDRVRIAISIVQKIPFGDSKKTIKIGGSELNYAKYPYEVLYDGQGVCGEKSELLAFILREMGYGVAFLYYPNENHEALAVKCPKRYSVGGTGYCLIETTGQSIMSDDEIEYNEVGKLSSKPELIIVSDGKSIGNGWYEFRDADKLIKIRNLMERDGTVGILKYNQFEKLNKKYGLEDNYNV